MVWVTLCFQFVSAASSASPVTAITFACHTGIVTAIPSILRTKRIWVWENVLDDLSVTLTQGHSCGIGKQKNTSLHNKVRTTYPNHFKICGYIPVVMLITWLYFGVVLLETFIWRLFFKNSDVIFKVKHSFGHISGMVGPINGKPRWRHQMETFAALLAICAGNSPVPGEFPAQRPVTWSFGVFFDLHPNKRLSKQWLGWWLYTPPCPLRRHRNAKTGASEGY